jgi:hypothetical protein
MKNVKPGAVRTQSPYPELARFGAAIAATGRFRENWGSSEDRKVATLEYALRKAEHIPPLWIMQGTENSIVSLLCFVQLG